MTKLPKPRNKNKNQSWGGDTSFYRTKYWKTLRDSVIEKNPLCVSCLKDDQLTEAKVVDHIVPLKKNGTNELKNLQGLCHKCHNRKTYYENKQI